jgi:hypothetical protein
LRFCCRHNLRTKLFFSRPFFDSRDASSEDPLSPN